MRREEMLEQLAYFGGVAAQTFFSAAFYKSLKTTP